MDFKDETQEIIYLENEIFIKEKFDPQDYYNLKQIALSEIRTRIDPLKRVEIWECKDLDGKHSIDIEYQLLLSRIGINGRQEEIRQRRAKEELCKIHGIPFLFADLLLSELSLSEKKTDEESKNRARRFGLLQ